MDDVTPPPPDPLPDRPHVIKMGGTWVWRCYHSGWVGDEFRRERWRDPWVCALAMATKHAATYHNPDEGEEV